MKALILDGKVVDLSETTFEVHESLTWVDCDESVKHGWLYDGETFTDPNPEPVLTAEDLLNQLRDVRNGKLADTDWWAVTDRTMTEAQTAYRQALRDITKTYSSLDDVVWPEMP